MNFSFYFSNCHTYPGIMLLRCNLLFQPPGAGPMLDFGGHLIHFIVFLCSKSLNKIFAMGNATICGGPWPLFPPWIHPYQPPNLFQTPCLLRTQEYILGQCNYFLQGLPIERENILSPPFSINKSIVDKNCICIPVPI